MSLYNAEETKWSVSMQHTEMKDYHSPPGQNMETALVYFRVFSLN